MSNQTTDFADLDALVIHLRDKLNPELDNKKYLLLFAYNGTGKTRLSMGFKEAGKNNGNADTLYFNAFTEDLFSWDNDLDNDTQRVLKLNADSRFFAGLQELEMDNRIRPLLQRYVDFDFQINTDNWTVTFEREVNNDGTSSAVEHIKISRGEENIFIWCFFLAIAQLAIDGQEAYAWVKYLYIDDPISSLDDNNAIAVASHLAQLLKNQDRVKAVISSHHTLFFNVKWNELNEKKKCQPYFLSTDTSTQSYTLRYTNNTPFFHGFKNFSACITQDNNDPEGIVHARMINVLSHGNYSLFEPMEMLEENKQYFKKILNDFMSNYRFNPELFPEPNAEEAPQS